MLSYESAITVLQSTPILIFIGLIYAIPLIVYIILGFTIKARSSDGRTLSKAMIYSPNFWWAVLIWGLFQLAFIILLVFPIFLRINFN